MNRNKILTPQGWIWLSVPVLTKGRLPVIIKDALIDTSRNWQKKHWNSIYQSYHTSACFEKYAPFFEGLYRKKWEKLSELNEAIIRYVLTQLGLSVKIVKASSMPLTQRGTELLIEICKQLKADTYIYGKHGEDYMDTEEFRRHNIALLPQNFSHPCYRQLHEPFVENMSIIDLLFNEGAESARIIAQKPA